MIDILIFVCGVVTGAGGLYALLSLYDWIHKLQRKVTDLKNELSFFAMQREQWYEFQDWKRMNQKPKD